MSDTPFDQAQIREMLRKVDTPDFAELKRKRDEAIREMVKATSINMGMDPEKVTLHVSGMHGCYCACPEGPCEHEFKGWREFEDGTGGETFCQKCGLGCMAHDMRVAP